MHSSVMKYQSVYFVVLLLGLLVSQVTMAQEENGLKEHAIAFQAYLYNGFGVRSSELNVGTFEGGDIALKYHLSKKAALRFDVGLEKEERNTDVEDLRYPLLPGKIEEGSDVVNFSGQFLYYPIADQKVNWFLGLGSFVRHEFGRERKELPAMLDTIPVMSILEQKNKLWSSGIEIEIGAEWFVSKQVSLLIEYGLDYAYTWGETTIYGENVSSEKIISITGDMKGFEFKAAPLKFGISFYL